MVIDWGIVAKVVVFALGIGIPFLVTWGKIQEWKTSQQAFNASVNCEIAAIKNKADDRYVTKDVFENRMHDIQRQLDTLSAVGIESRLASIEQSTSDIREAIKEIKAKL